MTAGTVALFDLDGTITRRGTYISYLLGFLARHPERWPRAAPLPLAVVCHLACWRDITWLKTTLLRAVLGGVPRSRLESWTDSFLDRVLSVGLRAGALKAIERYRGAGHRVVLVTASLNFYAESLGRRQLGGHGLMGRLRLRDDCQLRAAAPLVFARSSRHGWYFPRFATVALANHGAEHRSVLGAGARPRLVSPGQAGDHDWLYRADQLHPQSHLHLPGCPARDRAAMNGGSVARFALDGIRSADQQVAVNAISRRRRTAERIGPRIEDWT
jgi:haloacid dehalogenase-like hydrolase